MIDQIDDLQMAGQQMFQHAHRPSFQCLRKECVIGVGECSNANVPCLLKTQSLHINQQSNQFGNANRWMSVIQLDGNLKTIKYLILISIQTLFGNESNSTRIGSRFPYWLDLKRRIMSWSVAATRKYC